MEIILSLFIVLASLSSAIFLFKRYDKIKRINQSITNEYAIDHAKVSGRASEMRKRVLELEDHIRDTFSVSVRNDVTKVECVFNKIEMAFLMAGVYQLINYEGSSVDDKEFYIKLYKKIQENIGKMEEDPDES